MKLPQGWYPHSFDDCKNQIESLTQKVKIKSNANKAGIVPHAGWYYSAKAAVQTFATLKQNNSNPDVIIIIGGHTNSSYPLIYFDYDKAETPLGHIFFQRDYTKEIINIFDNTAADPNEGDNTIEVNLPFVKYFFNDTPLIAFRPPTNKDAILLGETLSKFCSFKKLNALLIASADLTHYGNSYHFTPKGNSLDALKWVKEENDASLIEQIIHLNAKKVLEKGLNEHSTCSSASIATAVSFAKESGILKADLLDYYTSYDVSPSNHFVGYASIVF